MIPSRRDLLISGLSLVAAPAAADDAQRRLRAADVQSYDYPTVQAILHMDRVLRERTKGRLAIQVFAAGQLGQEEDSIAQTQLGAVHLARVNVAALASMAPLCNLFCIPGFIESDAHVSRILDSDIMHPVREQLSEIGLVPLVFLEAGARSIYNKMRPITHPAHLRGLRIRTQRAALMEQTIAALGAVSVDLSYSQLLPALQADLIDGAENNWPSYVTTDQHRAAPYLTLTEHARPPEVVLVSRKFWEALAAPDRDALREAALTARAFHGLRFADWTAISRDQAQAEGVLVIEDFEKEDFLRLWRPIREAALAAGELGRIATQALDLK